MYIKTLELSSYRNIDYAKIEFCEGLNVFFGDNAQGKTNALEALFLCSATKSFRSSKENNYIGFNSDKAVIKADFFDGKNNCDIEFEFSKNDKRKVLLDGMACEKASDYIGRFLTVVFTPDHLSLVKSAPEERRKFLDLALCQSRPVILNTYKSYKMCLMQKSGIIKNAKETGSFDKVMLEIYNEKLAEYCADIAMARNSLCEKLSEYASDAYYEMAEKNEKLSFEYVRGIKEELCDRERVKNAYFELLQSNIESEISAGIPYYGIHRDDIKIKIDGKSAKEFASQGQQRSAVLAMKLAEGDYLCSQRDSMPVFLFDDILSELDDRRRIYILEKIKGKQVILTSCNREYTENTEAVKYFVKNGSFSKL